jgi:hypothetical protein
MSLEKLNFIDIRSNKMHTKFIHKHDTANSKPDVFKTSSLYHSVYVQLNEFTHFDA